MEALTRLALAARAGDGEALGAFVDVGWEQVWRFCASLVGTASADDLAQEAFARAVKALPAFRGDSSARTWLLAITRRACIDELRRRVRQRELTARLSALPDPDPGPSDTGSDLVVEDLLRRLGPEQRAAFVLTQILGLSYRETAAVCGCPVGTIRSRVARARAELLAGLDHNPQPGSHNQPEPRRRNHSA